jgi:cell division protease FtsH
MLVGRPGCGKTLTCKWLREECIKHNLLYRVVNMEDYRSAAARCNLRSLFKLPAKKSGIIFFDDMDAMVQNRKISSNATDLSTFLSELDGLDVVDGVVFIFTTNYINEADEAFVRPGRIDLWLKFIEPTEALRRKFVAQKFQTELLPTELIVDEIVQKTHEYTYAEMEEIRKLLCLDLINGRPMNVEQTFKLFEKHRKEFAERAAVSGFSKLQESDDDYSDMLAPSYLQ